MNLDEWRSLLLPEAFSRAWLGKSSEEAAPRFSDLVSKSPRILDPLWKRVTGGLPTEKMLLKALDSPLPELFGVFPESSAIKRRQDAMLSRANFTSLRLPRGKSRFLVIVQRSHRPSPTDSFLAHPGLAFDLWMNFYDHTPRPEFLEHEDIGVSYCRGTKTTFLSSLPEQALRHLEGYEYIALLDDDVDLKASSIEAIFQECVDNSLFAAQPALEQGSAKETYFWDALVKQPGDHAIIPITVPEVMAPFLSAAAFSHYLAVAPFAQSAHGIDLALGSVRPKDLKKISLLTTKTLRHTRSVKSGDFYRFLERERIYWRMEMFNLWQMGLIPEMRISRLDEAPRAGAESVPKPSPR